MSNIEKLLDSSLKLFMKYGVKSVSMDDIARKIGISKKTIYAAVDNKKDLVKKVVVNFTTLEEKDIKNIIKSSANAVEEMINIGKYVSSFFGEMSPSLVYDLEKYHPASWEYIENNHFAFIEKTIIQNIIKGQKAGLYRKQIHANIIAKLYIGQSKIIVDNEIFPVKEFPRSELFTTFFFYHLNGITTDKGRVYLNNKNDFK